jgi:hypothetical protein
MNIHKCIRCKNPIDYDVTDWCGVCDMSIFDDRMVKPKKMLTIKNIRSLEGTQCNGWIINLVSEGIYLYDDDLNIIQTEYYSITFVSGLGSNVGRILISREYDEAYKTQYRYIIYLNQKKFDTGGISGSGLQDKDGFIQSVVDTLDYQLKNK